MGRWIITTSNQARRRITSLKIKVAEVPPQFSLKFGTDFQRHRPPDGHLEPAGQNFRVRKRRGRLFGLTCARKSV